MSTTMEPVQMPLAPEPAHSVFTISAVLGAIWRRKLVVLGVAATAVVLGLVTMLAMPVQYTAQAFIRGDFLASDTLPMQVKNASTELMSSGSMSLDLARVIETQSRLLQSSRLARRVVEQIGMERLQPLLNNKRGWLSTVLHGSDVQSPGEGDELAIAGARLLSGLSVMSDPRDYLITVRFGAKDPDLAILVANSFVAELLRSTKLQVLLQQRYYVDATLSNQLGKFGEKHPKVVELRKQLAATDEALQEQLNESPDSVLQGAGENVSKAIARPSGPKPAILLALALLLGLTIGAVVALWLERPRSGLTLSPYQAHPLLDGLSVSPHVASTEHLV